jgi:2-oxoglutarate ferredoxin oxidoreductase subunit alpha
MERRFIVELIRYAKLGDEKKNLTVGYLHFSYVWPLKTELLTKLMKNAKQTILIEGNYQAQLGVLIRQETGMEIKDRILKYDGRPFFFDELTDLINAKLSA